MITYKPLMKLLIDKDMKKTDLLCIMTSATLAKLSSDRTVSLNTINDLCKFLDCNVQDIMSYVKD